MKVHSTIARAVVSTLSMVAVAGTISVIFAGAASATAEQCSGESTDSQNYVLCTTVNGGGLTVNYVEIAAENATNLPFDFPNASNCSFYPGFVIGGAGETISALKSIPCSTWANSSTGGSYVFSENKTMPAGEYCGILNFPIFKQVVGNGDDCVNVHA